MKIKTYGVIISLFTIFLTCLFIPKNAYATTKTDMWVSTNSSITDNLANSSDENIYRFQLVSSGSIVVNFINYANIERDCWTNYLYWVDDYGNTIELANFTAGIKTNTSMDQYRLPAGNYYIKVVNEYYQKFSDTDYILSIKYSEESPDSYEKEFNDSLLTANSINVNASYTGNLSNSNDIDFYEFTLWSAGSISINFKNNAELERDCWTNYLYWIDEDGNTIPLTDFTAGMKNSTNMDQYRLPAGNYYIKVVDEYYQSFCNADYILTVKYSEESPDAYEQEFNDSFAKANSIKLNVKYTGNISTSEDYDYYRFDIEKEKNIIITFQNNTELGSDCWVSYLYTKDADGNYVQIDYFSAGRSDSSSYKNKLDAGSYYLKICDEYYTKFENSDYHIIVKENKPGKPTALKVNKITTSSANLTWKKTIDATSYQIYRSLNKDSGFKKIATVTDTNYTNKNLSSGKTYYYKIRAVNSDNFVGSYSDVLTVKTKK